jgi:hypothetical protein
MACGEIGPGMSITDCLAQHTHCSNCSISFATNGGRCTVIFPLGMGLSLYAVCSECALERGLLGIPTVAQDCRMSHQIQRKTRVSVADSN